MEGMEMAVERRGVGGWVVVEERRVAVDGVEVAVEDGGGGGGGVALEEWRWSGYRGEVAGEAGEVAVEGVGGGGEGRGGCGGG